MDDGETETWPRVRAVMFALPDLLARAGVVEREQGRRVMDLALPVMMTAAVWVMLRIIDFLMVSLALSDSAVAGLAFAFQYYFVGFSLAIALSSGTISLVSRFKGAGDDARADLAVKQSLWFGLVLSVPLTVVAWLYAEPLVDLLTDDAVAVAAGATYLRIVMLAVVTRFWGMIGSRALAGAGDTRTPMYVSFVTIPLNAVLNAVLIFGVGPVPALGIAGAALGTAIANTLSALAFLGIFLSGRFRVRLRLSAPHWDADIARELVRVGSPLAGMRLFTTFGRFPFLFMLGILGTPVVAAYAIGRRVIQMAMIPAWGYSTAASTLVGQHVGADEGQRARSGGWATLAIALATQLSVAALIALAARPIAELFNTEAVGLTVAFVRVFALGIAGFATFQTLGGGLRGAGDTTWPLYGTVLGTVFRLVVAALGLPVAYTLAVGPVSLSPGQGLGVLAVYAALLVDWYVRAAVNAVRFESDTWIAIGRRTTGEGAEVGD